MMEIIIITLVVFLAVWCAIRSLTRRNATMKKLCLSLQQGILSPAEMLVSIRERAERLRSMTSLFNDEDDQWLRTVLPERSPVRRFRQRRIQLAKQYLLALEEEFSRLWILHDYLTRSDPSWKSGTDRIADLTLGFQLKLALARLALPLNYFRFRLAPLKSMIGVVEDISSHFGRRFVEQAK